MFSRKIQSQELKELQLNILKTVHQFCEDSGLRYSLAYGTLLGAIRHSGYIPWDDDIDIIMPRKDYDIFLSTFENKRYSVMSCPNTHGYTIPFAKVVDTNTILCEHTKMNFSLGVNIDVFPVDVCPPKPKENVWLYKKRIIDKIYNIRNLKIIKRKDIGCILKNIVIISVRIVSCPISLNKLCRLIQSKATMFENLKDNDRRGVLSTGYTNRKSMLPKEYFEHYKKITFEGIPFNCIENTHDFLTAVYGDYMKLPPESERISHHGFDAYWK